MNNTNLNKYTPEQNHILDKFKIYNKFAEYLPNWSRDTVAAFCQIIEEAYSIGLDAYILESTKDTPIRIGRKELGIRNAVETFATFTPQNQTLVCDVRFKHRETTSQRFEVNDELLERLKRTDYLPAFIQRHSIQRQSYWPADYLNNESVAVDDHKKDQKSKESVLSQSSLNQILYGPPGTGKTYHTIEAAVKAAEPGSSWETRRELKDIYDDLVKAKRIRFVTFHQSYGYEEFVEGLSATTTDNDQVKYTIKEGVFKAIADDARENLKNSQKDQQALNEEKKFEHGLEALKLSAFYDSDGISLTEAVSIIDITEEGFRYSGSKWKASQIMKFVDLKNLYLADVNSRQEVKQNSTVSGLAREHATYYFKALQQLKSCIPSEIADSEPCLKQNYVLVIDEINRGNISKIFGELITLIEPSKRMPAVKKPEDESLEIRLPHSTPLFSVPDNLYLIGTMNTADRSLAMMDTALRRRFDFVEMMPKPELLKGVVVNGIDLERLLKVLNERIEILYDREHTLGHAFFMPVKNKLEDKEQKHLAFSELVTVFQNKIIPLLEEYFFEDWDKIRLVLADNQKTEHLQFVTKSSLEQTALKQLFGDKHGLNSFGETYQQYSLKEHESDVWQNAKAYIGIYAPDSVKEAKRSDAANTQPEETKSEPEPSEA
ncbi:McrB family protein [Vibrio penaeicida]|uniref:McrB family protein n=1 Tax=Vibrio penaeicida TaxID=104609 RepID=UPI000CEA488A|nr:AAA family ATPase [Vibrio penaeicida]